MVQTALAGVIARRFGIIPGTEESIQASLRRAERVLGIVDEHLADHRFLAGEAVTRPISSWCRSFSIFPKLRS
jgi:glutathione S-transferase